MKGTKEFETQAVQGRAAKLQKVEEAYVSRLINQQTSRSGRKGLMGRGAARCQGLL